MEQQDLPLTPQMREALLEHRARNIRLLVRGGLAFAAVVGTVLACLLSATGDAFPYIAFMVFCFFGPLIFFGALHFWGKYSRVRRALAGGTYRHYVGPPHVAAQSKGEKISLILDDDRVPLDVRWEQAEPILAMERVTVAYSVAGQVIFAIWERKGHVMHQLADYDLRGDKEIITPGAGGLALPKRSLSRAAAPASGGRRAEQHPAAPGRYPLTPQMRACVGKNGNWPWSIVAVVLMPAAIGGVFHYLGAPAEVFLWMYGASIFLVGLLFVVGRNVDQRYAAMQAAGTYARYLGYYELEYRSGGAESSGSWYAHLPEGKYYLGATYAHDAAWLEEGQKRGTLIYSPEMETLFAIWDETGQLVYRARRYDLDGDVLVPSPVAA